MAPDKFFKKGNSSILSIDFGSAFIKIAHLDIKGDSAVLLGFEIAPMPSLKEDRQGVIDFIESFLRKNSVAGRDVCLTISEPDSVVIRNLSLPLLTPEEIVKAARWSLKEDLTFKAQDAIIDYQVLREYVDRTGAKKIDAVFVLADKAVVEKYTSIAVECKLSPIAVSIPALNYGIAINCIKTPSLVTAVLDVGRSDTTLCIYRENKLTFTRKLPFSSVKITESLTGVLVSDKGRVELSSTEAEKLKEEFGIPQDDTQLLKENIKAIQVISLMRAHLENLARDIKHSFEYFNYKFEEDKPAILYLAGGGSRLKNLDLYLKKELAIEIAKLPVPSCINLESVATSGIEQYKSQLVSVLSAVVEGKGVINLIPSEFRSKKIENIQQTFLRVTSIVAAAILLFLSFVVKFQISDYRNRLKNAVNHLASLKDVNELKQKVDSIESFINKVQKDRIPVSEILKDISNLLPSNMIIDEFNLDQLQHTLVLKGQVFFRVATGGAQGVVADFMQKLETSPAIREASLVVSQEANGVFEFQIRCDLRKT